MSIYIIDTHAIVWYFDNDERLSKRAKSILESPNSTFVVPTIVLAEIRHLLKKRDMLPLFREIFDRLENNERCIIYPFDLPCVENLDPRFDIHDGIIVATALVFKKSIAPDVAILTRDLAITSSGVIKTVW